MGNVRVYRMDGLRDRGKQFSKTWPDRTWPLAEICSRLSNELVVVVKEAINETYLDKW